MINFPHSKLRKENEHEIVNIQNVLKNSEYMLAIKCGEEMLRQHPEVEVVY